MYFRRHARRVGIAFSVFLRQRLTHGMRTENIIEAEERIRGMMAEAMRIRDGGAGPEIPDSLKLSVYTTEYLLSELVGQRNLQEVYAAQDRAKVRLVKEKAK